MPRILIAMPDAERLTGLLTLPAGYVACPASSAEEAARHPDSEILVLHPLWASQPLLDSLPMLRWLQFSSSGTDILARLRVPDAVVITSSAGMHIPQMTELVFFYMLSHLRNARALVAAQAQRVWQPKPQPLLAGKQILIVGVGAISEGLAERCRAFAMECVGISRRAQAPGFDRIRPFEAMADAAAEADFVVVLTPHGPETHHLIDSTVLGRMKPSAMLINVARGPVVDTEALIDALQAGTIGGAGLDVFEQEPLREDSPLWSFPNVIITPHIGGMSDIYTAQLAPIVQYNLDCWAAGTVGAMKNRVGG